MTPSLSTFQDDHRDLEELLLLHQEALVDRDPDLAGARLRRFRARLAWHARVEEELVVPAFEALGLHVRGGDPGYFRLEHAKLLELTDALVCELEPLTRAARCTSRDVLPLLGRGFRLQGVLEHHEQREDTLLYPALDDALPAVEVARLWERIEALRDEAHARA